MAEHVNETRPSPSGQASRRLFWLVSFIVIIPLVAGYYLSRKVVEAPKIGIIRLNYEIDGLSTYEITEQLKYAREDESVKAIVLLINSPGGSAAYSEELYLAILNTRKEMPVIASIDQLAASGGYFMAAAADEVYAKPTSFVGSIGVIASVPDEVYLDETVLTTGPYKSFGGTSDGFVRTMERAKFAFLEAVVSGRGDRLKVEESFLTRAEVYSGVQALEMGLVDELLSTQDAVERAAEMAGVKNYEQVELYLLAFAWLFDAENSYDPGLIDSKRLWAEPKDLAPGVYYRYLAPAQ